MLFFFAIEYFYVGKLFVGNTKDTYMSFVGKQGLNSFDVNLGVVHTCAMAYVYGKLKHGESVGHYVFAKFGDSLPFFFVSVGKS